MRLLFRQFRCSLRIFLTPIPTRLMHLLCCMSRYLQTRETPDSACAMRMRRATMDMKHEQAHLCACGMRSYCSRLHAALWAPPKPKPLSITSLLPPSPRSFTWPEELDKKPHRAFRTPQIWHRPSALLRVLGHMLNLLLRCYRRCKEVRKVTRIAHRVASPPGFIQKL